MPAIQTLQTLPACRQAPIKRHPLKGTLSRERVLHWKVSMNLPSPLILMKSHRRFNLLRQHLYPCRIFFGWRCLSLLHHAPIRIKVFRDEHPAGEKEQSLGEIQDPKRCLCSFEPDPLSASADPENLRYHAVSNSKKKQGSWVPSSALVAHGLDNKDVAKDQGGRTEAQSGSVDDPSLPGWFLRPSSSALRKTIGSRQRPPDLSGCNKRPGPVCGPRHNGPPRHSFVDGRARRPLRKPTPDRGCHCSDSLCP